MDTVADAPPDTANGQAADNTKDVSAPAKRTVFEDALDKARTLGADTVDSLSVRALAEAIGCGRTTASQVRAAVLEEQAEGNADEADTYALDVLSIVEATLDDPGPILNAQLDRVKTELLAELKRQGMEYEQRMEELAKCEHPKPLREFTYDLFDAYRLRHPWVGDHNIRPKSIAREMYERALGFADYIADYKVTRSEGLLLRYLGDAYKGLVHGTEPNGG